MSSLPTVDDDGGGEPALDGSLLLDLVTLAGWDVHVTLHDLGVKVSGRRGPEEIVLFGRSVAEVAIDFFKAAHATETPDPGPWRGLRPLQ
jgi:hypothetical protein